MAATILTLVFVGTPLAAVAFLVGHRIGKGIDITRKREVKAARLQLAVVCGQLGKIERMALNNPDSFVLSLDILNITRKNLEQSDS